MFISCLDWIVFLALWFCWFIAGRMYSILVVTECSKVYIRQLGLMFMSLVNVQYCLTRRYSVVCDMFCYIFSRIRSGNHKYRMKKVETGCNFFSGKVYLTIEQKVDQVCSILSGSWVCALVKNWMSHFEYTSFHMPTYANVILWILYWLLMYTVKGFG